MRRRLAILGTLVLGLLLTAGPVLAADGNGSGGDGESMWTGLVYAFFAGVVLGVIAFVDTTTGSNSLDDLEHDAH